MKKVRVKFLLLKQILFFFWCQKKKSIQAIFLPVVEYAC